MLKPKKIIISAASYINGHANISEHNFGHGLIIDGGLKESNLTWQFKCYFPGKYFLVSSYASNEIRTADLYLNNTLLIKNAFQNISGGFTNEFVKEFIECECELQEGINTLNLKTDNFIPHIKEFSFILKAKKKQNPLKKSFLESLEKKITLNPYLNVSPSLIRKFFNHLFLSGIKKTTIKTLKYISPFNYYKNNYADILGVLTKKIAFKGPKLVQIDITNQCNNNCIGCWCNSPLLEELAMPEKQKQKFIPYTKLIDLLNELQNMNVKEIYFSGGGEPFMHPEIMQILRKAKELQFIVYVNTNFTLLNRKKIEELVEIGIDHLTISVWAGNQDTYVKTHPNKTNIDFLRLKNNLIYLNSLKDTCPYTKIYNVISNINYFDLFNMFDFSLDTLSDSVEFTLIDIIPQKTDKLLLSNEELNFLKVKSYELLNKYQNNKSLKEKITLFAYNDFLRRIENSLNLGSGIYDKNIVKNIPCTIGWTFSRINADGEVNGCLKSHKIPVGNIFEHSFSEIWTSKKQEEFRYHTIQMNKNDPFFKDIGNDENVCDGCIKVCDDIGRNISFMNKMNSISIFTKWILKIIAYLYIKNILKPIFFKRVEKKLNIKDKNLFYKGFLNGKSALIGPNQVVIDLTNKCTRNCITCFTHSPLLKESKPKNDWFLQYLEIDVLKNLITSLKELNTERIRFTGGGDPLCYPFINEAVIMAKKAKLYTSITTSLPNVNTSNLYTIIENGIDEISISLMSSSSKTYKLIHPNSNENEFTSISNTIKKIRESYNIKITLCFVISNINYNEIFDIIEKSKELNATSIYFTLLDDSNPELKELSLTYLNLANLLAAIEKIETKKNNMNIIIENLEHLKNNIINKLSQNVKINNIKVPCSVGWHFTRILANGDVIPCCKATNHIIGNIKETSFSKIWNNLNYQNFRFNAKKMNNHKIITPFCITTCDNYTHNIHFYNENIKET